MPRVPRAPRAARSRLIRRRTDRGPGRRRSDGCAAQAWDWLTTGANWSGGDGIWHRLGEHLYLTVVCLAISCLLALPVALVLGHLGKGGALAVNISNVGRAVPTFAVLVLLLLSPLGDDGQWPTIIALVLFAIPPLLTNAYVGMRGVDRDVVESARGMGMTGGQLLAPGRAAAGLPADHDRGADRRRAGGGHRHAGRAAGRRRAWPPDHRRVRPPAHRPGGRRRPAGRRAGAAGRGRLRGLPAVHRSAAPPAPPWSCTAKLQWSLTVVCSRDGLPNEQGVFAAYVPLRGGCRGAAGHRAVRVRRQEPGEDGGSTPPPAVRAPRAPW